MSDEETAIIPIEQEPLSLLVGAPAARIEQATEIADALAKVIDDRRLYANISRKKYVLYEGWTTLGALVGVFPICAWSRKTEDGWEARVEAHTLSGAIVGAAEASCSREEKNWKNRDDYALRSMAQTRAGAKALRMPLGFIMALAGYEATPAEEMPREDGPQPAEPAVEILKAWACDNCGHGSFDWQKEESGRKPIPGTEKNCPGCGHVRGARPDPEPVEAEPSATE